MTDERQGPTTADIAEQPDAGRSEQEHENGRPSDGGQTLERGLRDGASVAEADSREPLEPLLAADRGERYRVRWSEVQTMFVDEPRRTVEEADRLVAELMQELAAGFSESRTTLEEQWTRGDDVSTEDLRIALQRYRSFFERLLAV
jgi:hypothetical protein